MAKRPPIPAKSTGDDKGKNEAKYWLKQIAAGGSPEKDWREVGAKIWKKYRNENRALSSDKSAYNILYANVEVLKGVLYQKPPIPEVRRRFRDKDPVGRVASEVLDRALTYNIDAYDFDGTIRECVLDRLVPGRGQVYVKYIPTFAPQDPPDAGQAPAVTVSVEKDPEVDEAQTVIYEETRCEYVEWDKFRMSPAKRWSKVKWVGFGEVLDEADLKQRFPKVWAQVSLDYTEKDSKSDGADDPFGDTPGAKTGRALVWAIWSKADKKVRWVTSGYQDGLLGVKDDPLKLEGFFPCPKPLYGQVSNDSLVPIPDYLQYQDQAEELNHISTRIINLVQQMKRVGVYDSQFPELQKILNSADGKFVAVENYSALKDKGGVENAIYEFPIEGIAKVVGSLYTEREQIINVIYDITGIGDIVRGQTNPNETLGAQQLKQNNISSRVGPSQREIQRFIRDILRLKAEIMAEHFSQKTLESITGIQLPTLEQRQQLQQQNPGYDEPTWDEVMQLLKNEKLRATHIDIETDSTLVLDEAEDKKAIAETINALGLAIQSLAPAVQGGVMSKEVADEILLSISRQGGFGYRVEEAIENSPPPQTPDPGAQEQQKSQMEMQGKAQLAQLQGQQTAQVEQLKGQQQMALQKMQNDHALALENVRVQKDLALEKMRHGNKLDVEFLKGTMPGQAGDGSVSPMADVFAQMVQALQGISQEQAQQGQAIGILGHAIQTMVARLSAPKRFVYDHNGQLAGREVVGFGTEPIQRDAAGKIIGTGSVQ